MRSGREEVGLFPKWYFRNRKTTWGPFSSPEINNLAAAGLLQPEDLVWSEEGDSRKAIEAVAVLDFSSLQRVAVPAPDWLHDVQEESGPTPIQWETKPTPEWIQDVGRWEGLQVPTSQQPPSIPSSPFQKDAKKRETVAAQDATILVKETKPSSPPSPSEPVIQPPPGEVKSVSNSPIVSCDAPTALNATTSAKTKQSVLDLMGFDPETGQIVDPDRFRKWQKEQKRQVRPKSGKSLQEIFLEGRRAVEQWIDAEVNLDLIRIGDLALIRQQATLQECLNRYSDYGPALLDKLVDHLEFMVDNRKRFLADSCQRR